MYTRCAFVFLLTVLCVNLYLSDASLCKPNSEFKIDCNICQCSSNGREYSCSEKICTQFDYSKYDISETKDGHKLLLPKKSNDEFDFDDGDLILTKKSRKPRVSDGYPYIADEMFKSIDGNDVSNSIHEKSNEEGNFIDVDGNVDAIETLDEEENKGNTIDDEDDEETNDVNHDRWARFLPRERPVFPE